MLQQAHPPNMGVGYAPFLAAALITVVFLTRKGLAQNFAQAPEDAVTALLVVDTQLDFMPPDGAVPTPHGDAVVSPIKQLLLHGPYQVSAFTLDCHPKHHISFASSHHDHVPQAQLTLQYTRSGRLCDPPQLHHTLPTHLTASCKQHEHDTGWQAGTRSHEQELDTAAITVQQKLWPDHCVMGTKKAQLHPQLAALLHPGSGAPSPHHMCEGSTADRTVACSDVLQYYINRPVPIPYSSLVHHAHHTAAGIIRSDTEMPALVVLKGGQPHMDAYSAFFDNGHLSHTGLLQALQVYGMSRIHVVGLAMDVCVAATARDARKLGFDVALIQDATAAVDQQGVAQLLEQLMNDGVQLLNVADVLH